MFFSLCRCTELPRDSPCYTGIADRNSNYSFPQNLPGVTIRSDSVDLVFTVLRTLIPPPHLACLDSLLHIACGAAFPPCDPSTQRVLPYCNDSCRAYKHLLSGGSCDDLNAYVRQIAATTSVPSFQELEILYFSLDCHNTSTYLFGSYPDLVSPNKCTNIIRTSLQGKIKNLLSKTYTQVSHIGFFSESAIHALLQNGISSCLCWNLLRFNDYVGFIIRA